MASLIPLFFFGVVLFSGIIQSDASKMKSFTEKVRTHIPDDIYNNLFQLSYKNSEDFKKAVLAAIEDFNKAADVKIPENISKEIKEEAEKEKDIITKDQFFQSFANAVFLTLKEEGKISKDNKDKLAESYANFLKDAAKSLKEEDVLYTLPAVTKATALFFKSVGLSGDQNKLQIFAKNFFSELDKL